MIAGANWGTPAQERSMALLLTLKALAERDAAGAGA